MGYSASLANLNFPPSENLSFYENLSGDDLQTIAENGGIAACTDIDLILPLIYSKRSILEVGGGYGRVIDRLEASHFQGSIDIIEPTLKFSQILKQKFGSKYPIWQTCVEDFNSPKKYDAILWMWSQINEFSEGEHVKIMRNLKQHLNPGGLLIIEAMEESVIPLFTELQQQRYMLVNVNSKRIKLFMLKKEDILAYAKEAGFSYVYAYDYETTKQRKRTLFILYC